MNGPTMHPALGFRARRCLTGALAAAALVTSGCGSATQHLHAERAVLAYQVRIGQINAVAVAAAHTKAQRLRTLRTTLARYRAVEPPASMRGVHRTLVASLRDRLRASEDAERALAGGDLPAVTAQVARGVRAQRRFNAALERLTLAARRCRLNRATC